MPTLNQAPHQEQLNLFSERTSETPFAYQEIWHTKQGVQKVFDTPNNENGFNSNKAISSKNQFHKEYPSGVNCRAFSVNKTKNTPWYVAQFHYQKWDIRYVFRVFLKPNQTIWNIQKYRWAWRNYFYAMSREWKHDIRKFEFFSHHKVQLLSEDDAKDLTNFVQSIPILAPLYDK